MEPVLVTRYVFTITAHVAGIVSAGDIGVGERRIIPIIGGEVRGRELNGKVCAFGADFQIVRPDSSIELEAKYAIETDDGAVIYVENRGIRRGPAELVQRLNRGEAVDPALIWIDSALSANGLTKSGSSTSAESVPVFAKAIAL